MKRTLPAFAFALAMALALPAAAQRESPQRVDERRPDEPLQVELFGYPIRLGGSWEYSDERRRNFDLTLARARDRRVREHELKLEAGGGSTQGTQWFLQAVGLAEVRHTQGTVGGQRKHSFERGQTWVRQALDNEGRLAVQAGRLPLVDRRAWWWDDDLDAIALVYRDSALRLQAGVGRELGRVSSELNSLPATERGVQRGWLQAAWRVSGLGQLEAFGLLHNDRSAAAPSGSLFATEDDTDPSDLRARWFGLRASGQWPTQAPSGLWPRLHGRAEAAMLRGREALTAFAEEPDGQLRASTTRERRLSSRAHDVGLGLSWPGLRLQPSLHLARAQGSGGGERAGTDFDFRQTGLHENKGRISGVKRVRLYGALLQPDLSNLQIDTVALGLRLAPQSSLELIHHRYRQQQAATRVAGSRLSTQPLGLDTDIGQGLDLVLALREWSHVEFSLVAAVFRPGAAFAANRRDGAWSLEFGAALNF